MSKRDLEPLDDDLAQLFASERDRADVGLSVEQRVAARLGATLDLPSWPDGAGDAPSGPMPGGGEPPPGAAPPGGSLPPGPSIDPSPLGAAGGGALGASAFAAGAAKPLVIGLLTLALGGAAVGVYVGQTSSAPPSSASAGPAASERAFATIPAPAPASSVMADPTERAAPAASAQAEGDGEDPPKPARPAGSVSAPGASVAWRRDDDLAAERAILEAARSALTQGQTNRTFALLGQHVSEFPRGRLGEEREALWIQGLLAAGRRDEARQRVARFKKSFPRSMLLPVFEQALGPQDP